MMKCNYYVLNPTNNVTVLVESQFPVEVQPFIAKKLLEKEKRAEQVGFILESESQKEYIKIRMSGGEFCGNACMAAACFVKNQNSTSENISISISGCNDAVNVSVAENDLYTVDMPKPIRIEEISLEINKSKIICPIVHFEGISHIIINNKTEKKIAEKIAKETAYRLNCEALGLLFVNNDFSDMLPLVYVKQADTMYWENSCASGTTALGYLLMKNNYANFPLSVSEPGGTLTVFPDENNNFIKLRGKCKLEYYEEFLLE